jgi:uncharacterized membrane protein YcaP (DUF421 family)
MPWYGVPIRSVILAAALIPALRLVGRRMLGQMSPLDAVAAFAVGTIAGSVSVNTDLPLLGGVLALGAWTLLIWVIGRLTASSAALGRFLYGPALVVVEGGRVDRDNLRKVALSEEALRALLLEQGVADRQEVAVAVLGATGRLGVLRRGSEEKR